MKTQAEAVMKRSAKDLIGYSLKGADGTLGKCRDFLFDDRQWTVRYLVADTGGWLTGRRVLISPWALDDPELGGSAAAIPVNLTMKQVEDCPPLADHEPISRRYEQAMARHYGQAFYWAGNEPWGEQRFPCGVMPPAETQEEVDAIESTGLRSVHEVTGYRISALDGEIGHIEDFVLETGTWTLRYLVVDTKNWLPGPKTLISPAWVERFDWSQGAADVLMAREAIKNSPRFDPSEPINRDYEGSLYDYYGLPRYW